MRLLENLSKRELEDIKHEVGEAFLTNELFHEWGEISQREPFVMKYMSICIQCVYESKSLYTTDDGNAYISVAYSDKQPVLPKVKMLFALLLRIPIKKLISLLHFVKEIVGSNSQYSKYPYTEIFMVCVKKSAQGQGYTRQLVDHAKEMARKRSLPLLFDTDMPQYAEIYEHLGCDLYNQITASNGVTRYSLVWIPEK